MSTPPETFSARFLKKPLEAVLAHLIGWLPDGKGWIAKTISEGGRRLGDPTHASFLQPRPDNGIWIQTLDPVTIPGADVWLHELSGQLFQHETLSDIVIGTTNTDWPIADFRVHPTRFGWAIATFDDENPFAQTGMLVEFTDPLPAGYEPKPDPDDIPLGRTRQENFDPGVDPNRNKEFMYELLVPAGGLDPVTGLSIGTRYFYVHADDLDGPRMRSMEIGAGANLAQDEKLLWLGDSASRPILISARVGYGYLNNIFHDGFTGGEDPDETLLRSVCRAFSPSLSRAHQVIVDWMDELPGLEPQDVAAGVLAPRIYGMRQTLEDWERYLGIPGSGCFPGPAEPDRDVRRRHVIVKMASLGVQTAQDFVDLAKILGVTILCQAGKDSNLFPTSLSEADARQTVVFTFFLPELLAFPYDFLDRQGPPVIPPGLDGLLFTDNNVAILQCLFEKLIPSTCQAKYLYVPT